MRAAQRVPWRLSEADAVYTDGPVPTVGDEASLQLYACLRFVAQPKAAVDAPAGRPTGCSVDDARAVDIYDAEARSRAFPTALLKSQSAGDRCGQGEVWIAERAYHALRRS